MKKYAIGFAVLLAATFVLAATFSIDYSWSPALPGGQHWTQAIVAVNQDDATRADVALPTTKNGEKHVMVYNNSWAQQYRIRDKVSSVPREPAGPAVDPSCLWMSCSLLGMGRDGVLLGEAGEVVPFDIDDDGTQELIQWVKQGGDEAFLVLDSNGNRKIDSGADLFGNYTPLAGSDKLPPLDDPANRPSFAYQPSHSRSTSQSYGDEPPALPRRYTPRTNGKAERFIQMLLREWTYARNYRTSVQRAQALQAYLHDNNLMRLHS